MKKDKVTAEAWVHWKQGDDFEGWLSEYSPPKALEMWGKSLKQKGDMLIRASEILADQEIEAYADTHHISLGNIDREVAEKLFKEVGLFYQDQHTPEIDTGFDKEIFTAVESFFDVLGCSKDQFKDNYTIYTPDKDPEVGKRRVALHFPTAYAVWRALIDDIYSNVEMDEKPQTPSKEEIMKEIRDEPYYISDNVLKRINGRPQRSLILSLDPEDDPEDVLLAFRLEKDTNG